MKATFQFSGHSGEDRDLDGAPCIGDTISGPNGEPWRVTAVVIYAARGEAEVACTSEPPPQILGDAPACILQS
jgi:hypothetical protein